MANSCVTIGQLHSKCPVLAGKLSKWLNRRASYVGLLDATLGEQVPET